MCVWSVRSYHVLLSKVALYKAVRMLVLEDLRVGEVVGVAVHGNHALVVATQLGQSHAVRLPGGHLHRETSSQVGQLYNCGMIPHSCQYLRFKSSTA